jgi:hypothetical protein
MSMRRRLQHRIRVSGQRYSDATEIGTFECGRKEIAK